MTHSSRLLAILVVLLGLSSVSESRRAAIRLGDLVAGGATRCDVAGDSREGIVLRPGEGVSVHVRVPPSGMLRFSLATTNRSPSPPWRLTAEDGGDGSVVASDETVPEHCWVNRTLGARAGGPRHRAPPQRARLHTLTEPAIERTAVTIGRRARGGKAFDRG